VEALAVGAMGLGVFLMYAAYKGEHPWTLVLSVIRGSGGPGTLPPTATLPPNASTFSRVTTEPA
jgi:hypothetical protein